jgi:hypothetical protein
MPASARARVPTVVILCPTAWGIRNVVLSGMLDSMREGMRVHLLTTAQADNAVSERWQGAGQEEMLCLPDAQPHRAHDLLRVVLQASFASRHGLTTYRIFNRWRRRGQPPLRRVWNATVLGLAAVGAKDPLFRWQVAADRRLTRSRRKLAPIVTQLRALAPDLVVSTSCVVRDEAAYLLAAQELGIPTLGCILSFDNLTSKGILPAFDHYAVWSDRMGAEVLRLYPDRDPRRVHVTGTPQFDVHRRADLRWSRARTLQTLGLDPGDRYLVYAANCATYTPTEPELVRAFLQRCEVHPVLSGHRLVVRPHPGDVPARWLPLAESDPRLVLSWPRSADGRFSSEEAQARLISTLAHADACLNMASTMSLDAAVLDTPVVCVAFALANGSLEDWLAGACYTTTHYAPIAASGGVRIATSLDALVAETASSVLIPGRDRAARARLVDDVCGPTDGRAAARVGALIRSLVGADSVPAESCHEPIARRSSRVAAGGSPV